MLSASASDYTFFYISLELFLKSSGLKEGMVGLSMTIIKGIFSDSNNIFLLYESEDINKKSLFPKFQLIPISCFQVMHDYVYFIAPIDYCIE